MKGGPVLVLEISQERIAFVPGHRDPQAKRGGDGKIFFRNGLSVYRVEDDRIRSPDDQGTPGQQVGPGRISASDGKIPSPAYAPVILQTIFE